MGQTVRVDLNARWCARFGQENGASDGETHAINACCINKLVKVTRQALYQFLFHPNSCDENLINQSKFTTKEYLL